MAKLPRRKLNNFLILSIIVFVALFNLPAVVLDEEPVPVPPKPAVVSLFVNNTEVSGLYFDNFNLVKQNDGDWKTNATLSVSANQLAERWLAIRGTALSDQLLNKLPLLTQQAKSLMVVSDSATQDYQITFYQMPEFWVMQNGQGEWLAVSVNYQYLFPKQ